MRNSVLVALFFISTFSFGQESSFAPAEDHKIYYQTFGDGEPIVIINGGPGMNSNGFAGIAQSIADKFGYQTIIYDQRGTGKSKLESINEESVTMDLMVADLEALRKHLGFKGWVVMGHSFGGMLASYYATQYPESIGKLILSSSGGIDLELLSSVDILSKLTQAQRDSFSLWSEKIANGDTSQHARLQRAKSLAPAYLYDKSYVSQIATRLTQANMTVNSLVFSDLRAMSFDCKEGLTLKHQH